MKKRQLGSENGGSLGQAISSGLNGLKKAIKKTALGTDQFDELIGTLQDLRSTEFDGHYITCAIEQIADTLGDLVTRIDQANDLTIVKMTREELDRYVRIHKARRRQKLLSDQRNQYIDIRQKEIDARYPFGYGEDRKDYTSMVQNPTDEELENARTDVWNALFDRVDRREKRRKRDSDVQHTM